MEVDEAVGAVREIADFAHDEDLGQAIIDQVLEPGVCCGVRISGTQLEPDGRLAQSWRGASEVRSPGLRPQA